MNPPSAIHGAMGRERKPFTYTPGGLDLSQIKSEKMAKRLMRNAMNEGVPERPAQIQSPTTPTTPIPVPNYNCLPVQVFPTFQLPANPKSLLRTRSTPNQYKDPVLEPNQQHTFSNNKPFPESEFNSKSTHVASNNKTESRPAPLFSKIPESNEYDSSRKSIDAVRHVSFNPYELPISSQTENEPYPANNNLENFNNIYNPKNNSFEYRPASLYSSMPTYDNETTNKTEAERPVEFTKPYDLITTLDNQNKELNRQSLPYNFIHIDETPIAPKEPCLLVNNITELKPILPSELIKIRAKSQERNSSNTSPNNINNRTSTSPNEKNKDTSCEILEYEDRINGSIAELQSIDINNGVSVITKPEANGKNENDQSEVKTTVTTKKQVKTTKKTKTGEINNNSKNGDAEPEDDRTVQLPSKKSEAKTETQVEVVKETLPDGGVKVIKTTTTKTTIDGRTEIKTRVETTIIPKETEEEEEEEYEEEEEESGVQVEEVKENGHKNEETQEKTVEESETPIVENGNDTLITKVERSETTTTKKVVVSSTENEEAEEQVEEEEEVEEVEETELEIEEKPEPSSPKTPPQESVEVGEDEVDEEEEEEEEIVEEITEKNTKEQEETNTETEKVEEEVEVEEKEEEEENIEKPVTAETTQEEVEEEEEEEYEEAEEEVTQEKTETETTVSQKNEVQEPPQETQTAAPEEKVDEAAEQSEVENKQPKEEKAAPEPSPEPKPTTRDIPILFDKVEDIEIKPIGPASEAISRTRTESTEIITSKDNLGGPISTQTELHRVENIVVQNRITKTLDQSYEQLTHQGLPTQKSYFAPTREPVSISPQPTKPYLPSYTDPTERRHSLLLDRLSVDRQLPPPEPYQIYNESSTYESQNQFQEPQSEVLTVSNVKPSMITNQQWYQQTKKENVIYNNVTPATPTPASQWSQPAQPLYQPQAQAPPQPSYQAPTPPQQQYQAPPQSYQPSPQPQYRAPSEPRAPIPQYRAPSETRAPIPQYRAPSETRAPIPQYRAPSETRAPIPQCQPSQTPQYQTPLYQPTQQSPAPQSYIDTASNYTKSTNTFQQNSYPSSTPTPSTWGNSLNNDLSSFNSTNQYSSSFKESTDTYKQNNQYSSSYVPPPWEQDSAYVAPETPQTYYQAPLQTTPTQQTTSSWKPAQPQSKFSKPPPTAYVPPAPNQSFVKPVTKSDAGPRVPGRKTYYSEYERRYISVPESTYVPGEAKYQPQPDPSPQYYYDNDEATEKEEHAWRKELREFTEKSSQTQYSTEQSVRPPWEEEQVYPKTPTTPAAYTPTPTWSQTLRPRSGRERTFESDYGSQDWPKTNTIGRGRPLSTYSQSNVTRKVERVRGVSVDRYNPNSYKSPIPTEHPPVQSHTLTPTSAPPAKFHANPNVPAYHNSRASAEPRELPASGQNPRSWGVDSRDSPIQSRSFKYLQWITGTDE